MYVVIRTNSFLTKLTINAEHDTVKHYGEVDKVNIEKVSPSSYYEFGQCKMVAIKNGRVVVTNNEDAFIGTIYLKATADAYDDIIIAAMPNAELPYNIKRDPVTNPTETGSAKLVVTVQQVNEEGNVQGNEEKIYLYAEQTVYESEKKYTGVTELGQKTLEALAGTGASVNDSNANNFVRTNEVIGATEEEREQNAYASSRYAGGSGTVDDPYLIARVEHLYSLTEDYEEDENHNCYKLLNDFTVEDWALGNAWYTQVGEQAVQSHDTAFCGTFDGDNHTIKFIYHKNDNVNDNRTISLFGWICGGAVVKNLTINCDLGNEDDNFASLSSYSYSDATFENITVTGKMVTTRGASALCLTSHETKYINCHSDVVIENTYKGGQNYVMAGGYFTQATGAVTIDNCTSTGKIYVNGLEASKLVYIYVGGFNGNSTGANYVTLINGSAATTEIHVKKTDTQSIIRVNETNEVIVED